MADVTFTVVKGDKDGIIDFTAHADAELGNAANGDYLRIPNNGKVLLKIYAATGDTWTFTPVLCSHGRTETLAPVVAAGDFAELGPWNPDIWNQADGCVQFIPTAAGGVGNVGDVLLAVETAL